MKNKFEEQSFKNTDDTVRGIATGGGGGGGGWGTHTPTSSKCFSPTNSCLL